MIGTTATKIIIVNIKIPEDVVVLSKEEFDAVLPENSDHFIEGDGEVFKVNVIYKNEFFRCGKLSFAVVIPELYRLNLAFEGYKHDDYEPSMYLKFNRNHITKSKTGNLMVCAYECWLCVAPEDSSTDILVFTHINRSFRGE